MDGETELSTIEEGSAPATTVKYWSKYQKIGGKWYSVPSTTMTVSATASDNAIKLPATATGVAYFTECENMTMSRAAAAQLEGKQYSGGVAPRHYQNSYWYGDAVSTEAGTYTLSLVCQNNNASSSIISIYYRDGSGNLTDAGKTFTGERGSHTYTVSGVYIPANCSLTLYNNSDYNSNVYIDYVTLTKEYSYTVKTSLGTTLAFGTAVPNSTVNYAYPRYIVTDGTLYQATKQSTTPYWGGSFALDADQKEVTVNYEATTTDNVVYYKEAENISGATVVSNDNTANYCSNKAAGHYEYSTTFVTLPAGTYKLSTAVIGNSGSIVVFKAGDTNILSAETSSTLTDYTSDEFTLTGSTAITVSGMDESNYADFVYIQKVGGNKIIGSVDYSTPYRGAKGEDIVLKKGVSCTVKFQNHGNGDGSWYNWLLEGKSTELCHAGLSRTAGGQS